MIVAVAAVAVVTLTILIFLVIIIDHHGQNDTAGMTGKANQQCIGTDG